MDGTRIEGTRGGERREREGARTAATPPPRTTYLKCLAILPPRSGSDTHAGRQAARRNERHERDRRTDGADRRRRSLAADGGGDDRSTGGTSRMDGGRAAGRDEDRARSLTFYTSGGLRLLASRKSRGEREEGGGLPLAPIGRFFPRAPPPRGAVPAERRCVCVLLFACDEPAAAGCSASAAGGRARTSRQAT